MGESRLCEAHRLCGVTRSAREPRETRSTAPCLFRVITKLFCANGQRDVDTFPCGAVPADHGVCFAQVVENESVLFRLLAMKAGLDVERLPVQKLCFLH